MTALSSRAFRAALTELADATPDPLPPATADAECDACGTDGPVHITPEGLLCQDCRDAEPQPYDWTDDPNYMRDDWENDR